MAVITSRHIEIGGITVELVRKRIKNLHIRVYPPSGHVRVAAPVRMSSEAIRQAVVERLEWIRKHQMRFANLEPQAHLEYVTGEIHHFMGQPYRLNVLHKAGPDATGNLEEYDAINLQVQEGSDAAVRERALYEWYRGRLKEQIPELLAKWEQVIGVQVAEWGVKRMKTRWGTCNIKARCIWLNLELARKPIHCLEYIIAHELTHLHERLHNHRFHGLMDRYVPLWRQYKDELKR